MIPAHFIAIALGFWLDRLIGDPPNWPHPVRWLGQWISFLTKHLNKGRFRTGKGAFLLISTVMIVFLIVLTVVLISYQIHILFGILIEALLIAIGLAQKSLGIAALDVYEPLSDGKLVEARKKLSYIVGRDTEKLSEQEISRATIETVSENTADGVTAPLFWAFLFGATGLWVYKAVNTLDSMVGYKDDRFEHFGKFSARTDDVFNFIPARISGLLIICVTPNKSNLSFKMRFKNWLQEARIHASPNSGYLEAATAWQLGIQLGGASTYRGVRSERATMGPNVSALQAKRIQQAIHQMQQTSTVFWLLFTMIGVLFNAIT